MSFAPTMDHRSESISDHVDAPSAQVEDDAKPTSSDGQRRVSEDANDSVFPQTARREASSNASEGTGEGVSSLPVEETPPNATEEAGGAVSFSSMADVVSNATVDEDEVAPSSPMAEISSNATAEAGEAISSSPKAEHSYPRVAYSSPDSPRPPPFVHSNDCKQHQHNSDPQHEAISSEHFPKTNVDEEHSSHVPLSKHDAAENRNIYAPSSSNSMHAEAGTSAGVQQRQNSAFDGSSVQHKSHHRIPNVRATSKAESKYKAYTRSPSDGEDIRWYFLKSLLGPNELAASTPTTDVVGKGECLRFSLRDSSSLEAIFLEREEEFVSAWWKEYAICNKGPSNELARLSNTSSSSNRTSLKATEKAESKATSDLDVDGSTTDDLRKYQPSYSQGMSEDDDEEIVGVPVKGGLYEVDILQRRCFPVYWSGENRRVLRGHWFARKVALDWLPLREDVAEQLEIAYRAQVWHRRTFQPSGQYAARVDLQGTTPGLHALFTGEDDSWEAWLDADAHGISYVLGLQGSGVKLRRGFAPSGSPQPTRDELRQRKEEDIDDYCSQVPVRHLVFMVHGIGQRLEKANLVDDVGTFRRTVATLAEEHLTSFQRNTQRVLFIPCQWRRHLKLGGESAVQNCTLEGVRALRQMISATVHDVLYYMSPVYCQDIIDSVSLSLNRLYQKFVKRNPGYDGKVSLYGHSLGSVLSYDILCHQEELSFSHALRSQNLGVHFNGKEEETAEDEPYNTVDNASHASKLKALKAKVAALQAILHSLESRQVESDNNAKSLEDSKVAEMGNRSLEKCSSDNDDSSESNAISRICGKTDKNGSETLDCLKRHDSLSSLVRSVDLDPISRENSQTISSKKGHTPNIFYTKLQFKVDTFFAVGSPLGLFLGLRNVRLGIGKGMSYWQAENFDEEMPACRQMLNIFHPYDPVAYRVEPLVCKEYVGKPPVFIPYHKGGKRLHIGMQEFNKGLTAHSKAISKSVMNVKTRMAKLLRLKASDNTEANVEKANEDEGKRNTYGFRIIQRLTGSVDGRIDYMLQDSTFEHQYISALSSHTSYWQDNDTALFILKHLYRDIPESPVHMTGVTPDLKKKGPISVPGKREGKDLTFNFFSKDEFIDALSHDATF